MTWPCSLLLTIQRSLCKTDTDVDLWLASIEGFGIRFRGTGWIFLVPFVSDNSYLLVTIAKTLCWKWESISIKKSWCVYEMIIILTSFIQFTESQCWDFWWSFLCKQFELGNINHSAVTSSFIQLWLNLGLTQYTKSTSHVYLVCL